MSRLPTVTGDNNAWGTVMNDFLGVALNADGTIKANQGATPASSQDLVSDGTKFFNILHKYRPAAYGAVGDGTTDDSTAINSMLADMDTAGRGWAEFTNKVYRAKNLVIYPKAIIDLNGAEVRLASSGTNSDDIFQTEGFNASTGTSADYPDVPYKFMVMNGSIIQPGTNTGRHCLALFGSAFTLQNLTIVGDGVGSPLWTEYGSNSIPALGARADWPYADDSAKYLGLTIIDGTSTAGVNAIGSTYGNDFMSNVSGVTNTTNPTITTTEHHYLTAGLSVTIASVGGATGVNGTFSVATVPSSTTFTITASAPGVYTSGGTVKHQVSAAWTNLGPHDSQGEHIKIMALSNVRGRRGLLNGKTVSGASATGTSFSHLHIYDNFNVASDCLAGNIIYDPSCQFEGSFKCCAVFRNGGRMTAHGKYFGGQGGVTLLDFRDNSNQNDIRAILMLAGSGAAPPSGFNNTYFANFSANKGSIMDLAMNHDYDTNCLVAAGTIPTEPQRLNLYMRAFGVSTATVTKGWSQITDVDSTHKGIAAISNGLTWTTA